MGIYDEGTSPWNVVRYGALIALLLLDAYLLLPSPFDASVSTDSSIVRPGDSTILWVNLVNRSPQPMTGVMVRVDSTDETISIEKRGKNVVDIPPGGEVTLSWLVEVGKNADFGDHMIRVFCSLPGETRVMYYKVRVG